MTLHHVSHGEGIPVLALHGWSPDHRLMTGCLEPIFADLPGYRRLYPDLPGMGQSPAGSIDSSDGIQAAVEEFIDAEIGAEPFLLIGESYGGYLSRGLIAKRPEQVLGLGLICPIGIELENADRTVPDHVVLRSDPGVLESTDRRSATSPRSPSSRPRTHGATSDDVVPGLDAADTEAMERIRQNWALRSRRRADRGTAARADPVRTTGLRHRLRGPVPAAPPLPARHVRRTGHRRPQPPDRATRVVRRSESASGWQTPASCGYQPVMSGPW